MRKARGTVVRASLGVLLCLCCAGVLCETASAGLIDGLIGYWQFEGNPNDASGNGRDLVTYGGLGYASGLFGQAADFTRDITKYAQRPVSDAFGKLEKFVGFPLRIVE